MSPVLSVRGLLKSEQTGSRPSILHLRNVQNTPTSAAHVFSPHLRSSFTVRVVMVLQP